MTAFMEARLRQSCMYTRIYSMLCLLHKGVSTLRCLLSRLLIIDQLPGMFSFESMSLIQTTSLLTRICYSIYTPFQACTKIDLAESQGLPYLMIKCDAVGDDVLSEK
ncbi:hypothetical protein KC19_8G030400 [Ceratodon purpureus]|uniref:Uncharacterized protein n=1 Tax=Ceratodon purpureus TaxID=3225 RepID=A0A8T0GUR3_CERPU|nr:hypothetical protein KC19_8G030400 [Ceratodon purpureus]